MRRAPTQHLLGGNFIKFQRVLPAHKQDRFIPVHTEKLVRQHKRALGAVACLAVRAGTAVYRGKKRRLRRLAGLRAYRQHAAFLGDILRRHQVVASEE